MSSTLLEYRAPHLGAAVAPWTWFLVRDLHPLLDGLAIVMPLLALAAIVGAAALAFAARSFASSLVALAWLLMLATVVLGPWLPQGGADPADGYRIVSANIAGQERDIEDLLADLQAQGPDLLVGNELGIVVHWQLERTFNFNARGAGRGGISVFSRWPLTAVEDPPTVVRRYGIAVEVAAPDGPFVLYAMHLPRPWPTSAGGANVTVGQHRSLVDDLLDAIHAEPLPVVIAGDLNLSDRTSGYRALTDEQTDAMRSGWARPTSIRWAPLLLRIDHIMLPADWCTAESRYLGLSGSDHLGVSALVGPCAAA